MDGGNESAESEHEGEGEGDATNIFYEVLDGVFNIEQYRAAFDINEKIHWRQLSFSAFMLGIGGFSIWILYVASILGLDFVLSSRGVVSLISRLSTVLPITPIAVLLTLFAVSEAWQGIRSEVTGEDRKSGLSLSRGRLLAISLGALIAAFVMRVGLYRAARVTLQDDPIQVSIIGLMLVDIGYLSLLLIGLGAMGGFIFTQNDGVMAEDED